MCMDEFVKRSYDFMGIYRIFWSQNSHYRYFFRTSNTSAHAPRSRFFDGKIGFFLFFDKKSKILSIFSFVFSSRCRSKTDFIDKKNDFLFLDRKEVVGHEKVIKCFPTTTHKIFVKK